MARNQGLIDFNAFLGGIESAQKLNRQNQLMENQIFRENHEIMNMLQTDEDKRIKRDAGRYLSTIPLNRISAVARDKSGMSSADHAIAQLRAIEQDPYFQQNAPEFQNQVLNSLAESAAVQMQQYLKSGEVNELAKLAEAFGQVDPLAQGTRAAARGASQDELNAVNRQWGMNLQMDADGNIAIGDYSAPAHIIIPAAARGGHASAVSAAMEWDQSQQGIKTRQDEADINKVYQALALQQLGVDPSVLEKLGLTPVPLIADDKPQANPTATPQANPTANTPVVPTQTVPPSNDGVSTNTPAEINPAVAEYLNSLTLQDVQNMGLDKLLNALRLLNPTVVAEAGQVANPSISPGQLRTLQPNPFATPFPRPDLISINDIVKRLGQ